MAESIHDRCPISLASHPTAHHPKRTGIHLLRDGVKYSTCICLGTDGGRTGRLCGLVLVQQRLILVGIGRTASDLRPRPGPGGVVHFQKKNTVG